MVSVAHSANNMENKCENIKTHKKEIHWKHNQGKKKWVGSKKQVHGEN